MNDPDVARVQQLRLRSLWLVEQLVGWLMALPEDERDCKVTLGASLELACTLAIELTGTRAAGEQLLQEFIAGWFAAYGPEAERHFLEGQPLESGRIH